MSAPSVRMSTFYHLQNYAQYSISSYLKCVGGKMDKVLMSGLMGGASGAMGFALAQKIHGKDVGEKCYPLYALALFCTLQILWVVLFSH